MVIVGVSVLDFGLVLRNLQVVLTNTVRGCLDLNDDGSMIESLESEVLEDTLAVNGFLCQETCSGDHSQAAIV